MGGLAQQAATPYASMGRQVAGLGRAANKFYEDWNQDSGGGYGGEPIQSPVESSNWSVPVGTGGGGGGGGYNQSPRLTDEEENPWG
jgi:hypothetical protein